MISNVWDVMSKTIDLIDNREEDVTDLIDSLIKLIAACSKDWSKLEFDPKLRPR